MDNTTKITVPSEQTLATVSAWPDEIQVEVHSKDGNLTIAQGRQLARAIDDACDQAERIDWSDDAEPKLVPRA